MVRTISAGNDVSRGLSRFETILRFIILGRVVVTEARISPGRRPGGLCVTRFDGRAIAEAGAGLRATSQANGFSGLAAETVPTI